jgi:hypothetical protein
VCVRALLEYGTSDASGRITILSATMPFSPSTKIGFVKPKASMLRAIKLI